MKKLIKLLITIMIISIIPVMTTGCTKKNRTTSKTSSSSKIQIGISFDSFVIERWLRDRDAFTMKAQELGAKVNVQNANGDIDEQISQIKYLIKKKVDVIVIIPVDCDKLSDVVNEAEEAGIKVICYDRLIKNADTDLYISFDNEAVGADMANALVKAIPEGGNIFMINGSPSDNNVTMVKKGFDSVISKSNLNVIYEEYCKNWSADEASAYAEEAVKKYKNVKGIMCGNDDLASAVSQVLSENRMSGKVAMVGQDADLLACQRIVEGTQTMTVFKKVEDLAEKAACFAVELAKGKNIDADSTKYYTH